MSIFAGLFSHYQPLRGSGWLSKLPPLDRKVFSDVGRASMKSPQTFQSEGGKARAASAARCDRGHFMAKGATVCPRCEARKEVSDEQVPEMGF